MPIASVPDGDVHARAPQGLIADLKAGTSMNSSPKRLPTGYQRSGLLLAVHSFSYRGSSHVRLEHIGAWLVASGTMILSIATPQLPEPVAFRSPIWHRRGSRQATAGQDAGVAQG